MANLSAPEQNRLLAQLASLLRGREEVQAQMNPTMMGTLMNLILPSAQTVEKMSYGDPMFRMPPSGTGGYLPLTTDKQYAAEIAGMVPVVPLAARPAARAAQQGIESATPVINRQYEQIRRPLASPVFNTEVAVTNPALLQNVDLNNAAGIALSRERLNAARQATGSEYANAPMSVSQGAWQGTQGFEANPVFMQELPRSMGRVKDQDYMKYIAQTSENLTQDANAVARFVPFLLNDTIRSNAAIIKNVTPEQLKKLGEAGLTNDMVIAARPGNKALVMGFDDEPGQIPQLIDKIKKIVPDVKFETGISRQDVDRIYMVRNPDEFGTPTYEDFGATSRPSGLLDTLDERLRQESY
jgi:hypothetical protein